ncbi:nuclear transport factor 2 family protein [Pseudonocardia kunmingensis]|uniref:SnoaL-like protein n=1 Tax=Pseudonocardia kunmingensis TaxID=630975 RepID=A0A543DPV3_9PSEU|nr:nuclear transport factor 2 family protein [Pseudonocardia kunmingensis]TQM11367.1 SnoaL-like protein [Pseudonocardia kunmingensis]
MDVWELIARERIRDTVAAYNHAGDRGRIDDLAATFTEDGVLEVVGRDPAAGRAAIVAMLSRSVERGSDLTTAGRPHFVRHFVTNLRFEEVTPERARTSAYFLVVTPAGPDHWGRYRDVHVPVGDEWQIAHRMVRVDAKAEGSHLEL